MADRARLLGEYEAATRNFAESVGELRQNIGTSAKDEYERLQRASDEARVKSEQSRLSLEQLHELDHDAYVTMKRRE